MNMHFATGLVAGLSLVSSLSSQVSCSATVVQDLEGYVAYAMPPGPPPVLAGTDVTAGVSHTAGYAAIGSFGSTSLAFSMTHGASIVIAMDCNASGLYPVWTETSGVIRATCTSVDPIPVDVTIRITYRTGSWGATRGSVRAIGQLTTVLFDDYGATQPLSPPTTITRSYSTILDASGLSHEIDMDSGTGVGFGNGGQAYASVEVIITPTPLATTYGSPCGGASMSFESSFATPPTVTFTDPSAVMSILVIGTQQIDLPLDQILPFPWPCPLRNDAMVAIPLPIGPPSGSVSFRFLPPVGTFTMQALTSDGVTSVNTTNGLSFVR